MKSDTTKKLLAIKTSTLNELDNRANNIWLNTTRLINIILESYLGLNNDLIAFREELANMNTFHTKNNLKSTRKEINND